MARVTKARDGYHSIGTGLEIGFGRSACEHGPDPMISMKNRKDMDRSRSEP